MDLEKLNKTQIILLVLFVSFVTSIATGIVTVTLMDQAPPAVTQTINRVVERTVEKVVPAKSQGASTVKTVIVKEESLVADLVEKNTNNVVEIFTAKNMVSNEDTDIELEIGGPVALGFVISSDGMIVADSGLISNKGKYIIQTKNKTARRIYVVGQDEEKGIALLKIEKNEDYSPNFEPPPLADSENVKLGQSVISLNKKNGLVVLTGIISKLQTGYLTVENKDTEEAQQEIPNNGIPLDNEERPAQEDLSYLVSIFTTIDSPQSGSILLDMDGSIIGMNIVRDGVSYAVPSNTIKEIIIAFESSEDKNEVDSKSAETQS